MGLVRLEVYVKVSLIIRECPSLLKTIKFFIFNLTVNIDVVFELILALIISSGMLATSGLLCELDTVVTAGTKVSTMPMVLICPSVTSVNFVSLLMHSLEWRQDHFLLDLDDCALLGKELDLRVGQQFELFEQAFVLRLVLYSPCASYIDCECPISP